MFIKTNLLTFYRKAGKKWLSCLSIMLLLLSLFPAAALGAVTLNPYGVNITVTNSSTTATSTSLNASDISKYDTTIELKLTGGNTWNSSIKSTSSTTSAAIDLTLYPDLTECFTTTAGAIQLEALLDTATFMYTSDEIITMTIPKLVGQPYNIKANQTITFTPPKTMLKEMVDVTSDTFNINADYAKISGSLTSGATEANIKSGGKELIIELNNCLWNIDLGGSSGINSTGAAITALFDTSDFSIGPDAEKTEWNKVTDALSVVNSIAVSPDNKKLTITLPVVPPYNISDPQTLTFNKINPSLIKSVNSVSYTVPLVNIENNSFTISPVSQSATLSGTVMTATESDIIAGEKTLVITLKNDIWAQNVPDLSPYITLGESTTSAAFVLPLDKVKRTSNTVLTITLPPTPFDAKGLDQTIKVNIPGKALVSGLPIDAGSFPIKAVTVKLSGTAITSPLTGSSVIAGGKTIVITLKEATWKSNVITANRTALLGCFKSSITTAESNWAKMIAKIEDKDITLSGKNVLTIKLPKTADYKETGQAEVVEFTLNPNLVNELGLSNTKKAPETLTIGQTAVKANLASITPTVPEVVQGGQKITVTLLDGSWDPLLPTNKSKISSLVSGFKAESDPASWTLVQTALKNSGVVDNLFTLESEKVLEITLPAVPGYDPVKTQKISLTIPKAVLVKATSDIPVDGSIQISLPSLNPKGKLQDMLGEGMVALIKDVSLQKIYLSVPTKYITSVVSKQSVIQGNTTVNSLDIITDGSVTSVNVKVTVKEIVKETGDEAIVNETNYSSNVPENYGKVQKFNVGFATLNSATTSTTYSEAEISVLGTATPQSVTIKIGGSKTYKYTDLSGSYSLYKLMNNSSLLKKILDNYAPTDIIVQTI